MNRVCDDEKHNDYDIHDWRASIACPSVKSRFDDLWTPNAGYPDEIEYEWMRVGECVMYMNKQYNKNFDMVLLRWMCWIIQ